MSSEDFEKSQEELELEKIVFGDVSGLENALLAAANGELDDVNDLSESDDSDIQEELDNNLFYVDTERDPVENESEDEAYSQNSSNEDEIPDAWVDDELDQVTVSLTEKNRSRKLRSNLSETSVNGRIYQNKLRAQFLKLHPAPSWASLQSGSTNSDNDEMELDLDESHLPPASLAELLAKKTNYLKPRKQMSYLPAGEIDIGRLQDLTKRQIAQSSVSSLQFHPSLPLALIAGFDQTLRLYHVDGRSNPVANTLFIKGSPFKSALFHPDGQRIFAGGRRRYLYIWDLATGDVEKLTRMYGHQDTQPSMEKFVLSPDGNYIALVGKNGWINVLSTATAQWISGAKIEGAIADLVWEKDNIATIASREGEVYTWSAETQQFTDRWRDVGGAGITAIAQCDRWLALGMSNGILSIFDRLVLAEHANYNGSLSPRIEQPKAVIENLTTAISTLKFSPDGQVLAAASKSTKDALKLVHLPSCTVFKNWPTSATPLGRVTEVAFSASGALLSTANDKGVARLFQLNHYS